jgi:hypothetical protein
VRSHAVLIENIRSWRARFHRANYNLKDYFSQMTGRLRRLNYGGIKLCIGSVFSNGSCFIYKLDLANVSHLDRLEDSFPIQRISGVEAIKFTSEFHHCNSPTIWGNLLKREIEGTECYGTFYDNKLIHTSWVTDKNAIFIDEIGESLLLGEGGCCVFDCNTLSQYRGRAAYPRTLMHIARVKKASGYNSLYIYTPSYNAASIRGIEKAGFELSEVRELKSESLAFRRQ